VTPIDTKKLAAAWISHQETFWACEKLADVLARSYDEAWPIVMELIEQAPSESVLFQVAAGPLEDILGSFADRHFDRVKELAAVNEKFRQCLLGIRVTGPESERVANLIGQIERDERLSRE